MAYGRDEIARDEVRELAARLPPGEYALAIAPASLNDIPFARNAQGGLMLPPVMPDPIGSRVLVQTDEEVPGLPAKIADDVVTTLRAKPVSDFVAGQAREGRDTGVSDARRVLGSVPAQLRAVTIAPWSSTCGMGRGVANGIASLALPRPHAAAPLDLQPREDRTRAGGGSRT